MASNTFVSKKVFKNGYKTSANSKMLESFQMFDSSINLSLILAEITEGPRSDVLVSCTGPHYEYQSGVSAAVTRAAGLGLIQEYSRLLNHGPLQFAQVSETPPFDLKQNHDRLFHVRSPTADYKIDYVGNQQIRLTWLTYSNLLRAAFVDQDLESLSLPVIGTGVNGLTIEESVTDLVEAIHDFVRNVKSDSKKKREIFLINNETQKIQLISETIDETLEKIFKMEAKRDSSESEDDTDQKGSTSHQPSSNTTDQDKICVICMDKIPADASKVKVLDKCQHEFCKECIESYFASAKKSCPVCNTAYGVTEGTQPNGTMSFRVLDQSVPGYGGAKTIEITYSIPDGTQGPKHPNPGQRYYGAHRTAFLPDTQEGREVLDLLKRAFNHKLTFTVGQSRTTGANDTVTWNDIHHKTSIHGGPTNFGYPDPTYLSRVKQELADKGIV